MRVSFDCNNLMFYIFDKSKNMDINKNIKKGDEYFE